MEQGYSREEARRKAASGGGPAPSEHQLGLAVDVWTSIISCWTPTRENTAVQKWLLKTAGAMASCAIYGPDGCHWNRMSRGIIGMSVRSTPRTSKKGLCLSSIWAMGKVRHWLMRQEEKQWTNTYDRFRYRIII